MSQIHLVTKNMSQIVYNEEIKSYDLHTTFLRFLRNNNINDCLKPV